MTGEVSAEGGRGASPELFGENMNFQDTANTEIIIASSRRSSSSSSSSTTFTVAPAGAPRKPWPLSSLNILDTLVYLRRLRGPPPLLLHTPFTNQDQNLLTLHVKIPASVPRSVTEEQLPGRQCETLHQLRQLHVPYLLHHLQLRILVLQCESFI